MNRQHASAAKPYRPNVGIALFNAQGLVLIAQRLKDDGPEIILPGHDWQMPQGGIDGDEDPQAAARRELHEETRVTSARYLGETAGWLSYDFPAYGGPAVNLSRFRGQRQKWFAFAFTGADSEIELTAAHVDEEPEFGAWRWERLARLPELVVPFKRAVYEQVATEFAGYGA
jgi:putative (di)nucleoside polyphosphate hydrolase